MSSRPSAAGAMWLVATIAVGLGCGAGSEGPSTAGVLDGSFDAVEIRSPGIALGEARVTVSPSGDAASWRVEATCREPAGCRAMLRLAVHFTGAEGPAVARITTAADVDADGLVVAQGVRRPVEPVTRIDRVEVTVLGPLSTEQPTPFD